MYHPFTIGETIRTAWDVIKKNYVSLIVYAIVSLLCYEVISFISNFIIIYDNVFSKIIFVLFMMFIQSYLALSFYKLILTLIDREYYEFDFKDIVPSLRMALSCVTIGIAYTFFIGTIIYINFLLHDKPMVREILDKVEMLGVGYLLIRSIFCLCFIVDDDSSPFESLRQSFAITRNNFFKIIALILIVLAFVALLLLIINLIITLFFDIDSESSGYAIKVAGILWFAISFPTVQVMIMATYRKLVYSYKDIDDDVSETL